MKTCRIVIALIVACCMFSVNQVLAQEFTADISTSDSGTSKAPFAFKKGTALNLNFNQISINGNVSVGPLNVDFDSNNGTINSGKHTVVLGEGSHTATVTIDFSVSTTNNLINRVLGDPEFTDSKIFTSTITVPPGATQTFEIEVIGEVRDLNANVSGSVSGNVNISGVLGSTVPVVVVFTEEVPAGDNLSFSGSFSAKLVLNMRIEALSLPPVVDSASIAVLDGGDAFVTSTLEASATGTDPEDGALTFPDDFSLQWLKNGSPIPGATGTTLTGQFVKRDKISAEVTATDSGGKLSEQSRVSNEIEIKNSLPLPATVSFRTPPPDGFTVLDTLTLTITPGTDADNDPVTVNISWDFDGVEQTNLQGFSTAGPGIAKGTVVRVQVVSNDGEADSLAPHGFADVTIKNVLPIIGEIGTKKGKEGEEFSISIPVSDADEGDQVTVTATFILKSSGTVLDGQPQPTIDNLRVIDNPHVNGTPINIPAPPSGSLVGATFTIRLIAKDSVGDSEPVEFDLEVRNENTLPAITGLTPVTLQVPLDGTSVSASVTISATDADNEPVSLQAVSTDSSVAAALSAFNSDNTPDSKTLSLEFDQTDLTGTPPVGRVIEIKIFADDGNPGDVVEGVLSVGLQVGAFPPNIPPTLDISDQELTQQDPPVANDFSLDLRQFATDPDWTANQADVGTDPPLTFSLLGDAPTGANLAQDGTFTWDFSLQNVEPGVYIIPIRVTDQDPFEQQRQAAQPPQAAQPQSAQDLLRVIITNPNDPPTIRVADQTVEEGDTSFSFAVSGSDPERRAVSFSVSSSLPWLSFDPGTLSFDEATNTFTQTASAMLVPFDVVTGDDSQDANGIPQKQFELTFIATDPQDLQQTATMTLTVKNKNRPPVFDPIASESIQEGQILNLPVKAIDPDDDKLTYTKVSGDGQFDPDTLIYTLDLSNNFDATIPNSTAEDTAVISVDDGLGGTDELTVPINIDNQNRRPIIAAIGDQEIPENPDQPSEIQIDATDPDLQLGESLPLASFSLSAVPALPFPAQLVEGSIILRLTPGFDDAGVYNVTVSVNDNDPEMPLTASESFRLKVANTNRPPEGTIGDLEVDIGSRLVRDLSSDITDPDDDEFTFERVSGPDSLDISASGLLVWTVPVPADLNQIFSLVGRQPVQVKITDKPKEGDPLEITRDFNVRVTFVNVPPNISTDIPDQPVLGAPVIQPGDTLRIPNITATDLNGDEITFRVATGPGEITRDSFITPEHSSTATATFTWTPEPEDAGQSHEIILLAEDGQTLDPSALPLLSLFGINVTGAVFTVSVGGTPPIIAPVDDTAVDEGVDLSLTFNLQAPLVPNRLQAANITWSHTLVGTGTHEEGNQGTLTPSADGTSADFDWNPGFDKTNLNQTYTLTVRALNTDTNLFDIEQVNIAVTDVNRPPEVGQLTLNFVPPPATVGLVLQLPQVTDEDDDPTITDDDPVLSIQWTSNGVGVPEFDNALAVPRTAMNPGEVWEATVVAVDPVGGQSDPPQTANQTIPDTPAELDVQVRGGINSDDPVVFSITFKDPDLTPPPATVNMQVRADGNVITDETIEKESGGDPTVGRYNFETLFTRGDYTYTVTAEEGEVQNRGVLNRLAALAVDKSGSFSVTNTAPEVIPSEINGVSTGTFPINYALTDIDDDELTVTIRLDGQRLATLSGDNPLTTAANDVIIVNWNSDTDLPNARGETHRLDIIVSDGELSRTATMNIRVLNRSSVFRPFLFDLLDPSPLVVSVKGIKREGIEFRRRFFQLEIPFGAQLFVNGQQVRQLPETFDGDFEFENVELIEGRNVLQARLTILVRYTGRLCVLVGREPRHDRFGRIIRDRRGRVRYRYIYAYVSRTFEFRYRGPFSNRIVANVDGRPPLVNILGPDEIVPTRTPKLVARFQDQNLDPATIVFDLDGREIRPSFNSDTGLAQFTPPADNPFAFGPHILIAKAKDKVNNEGSDKLEFTIDPTAGDTKPPVTVSLSPEDGSRVRTLQTPVTVRFSDAQSPLDPDSRLAEVGGQSVTPSFAAIDPLTGELSFTATANADGIVQVMAGIADGAKNLGTRNWSFEVDTIGPTAPSVNALGVTKENAITITGSSEPGATNKLILNGTFHTETTADRTSGAYSFIDVPLQLGENTVRVIPADDLGNVGTPSALTRILRDEVSPTITILSPLENQILPNLAPSATASINDAGGVDRDSISLGVRIESTNGVSLNRLTTLQAGDVVPIANFDFNSNTGILLFTLPELPDQSVFTVIVGAADVAGNSPSQRQVTAQINTAVTDRRPPAIANVRLDDIGVASGSTGTITGNNQPTISASIIDAESGVNTVEIRVNGSTLTTNYDEGTATAIAQPDSTLADGSYNVTIDATDNNNNPSSFFFSFNVATTVPQPVIVLAPNVERTQEETIGVIASNVQAESTATWVVNGTPVFARTFNPGESSFRRDVLLDIRANEISVEVRDPAGNTETSDTLAVERDIEGPQIFLDDPVNGSTVPGLDIGGNPQPVAVNLRFRDAGGIQDGSVRIRIVSPSGAIVVQQNRLVAVAAAQIQTEVTETRTIEAPEDGTYTVTANATDGVGNPARLLSVSFRVDSTPPEMRILVPTQDAEIINNSIPGLSAEIDSNDVLATSIVVQIDGNETAHSYNAASGQIFVLPTQFASDPNAVHTLSIEATDAVGNRNSASSRFIIDTSAVDLFNPVLSGFFPQPGGTVSSTSIGLLQFIAADGGGVNGDLVLITINGRTFKASGGAVQFRNGRFTIRLDRLVAQQISPGGFQFNPLELGLLENPLELGLLEDVIGTGLNIVSVQVSDLAGNFSIAEWSFNVVTEAPAAPVLDALDLVTAQEEISLSGQVPEASLGVTVTVFANDVLVSTASVGTDGTFTAEGVLLIAGENQISALAVDIAGNQSGRADTQTVLLDIESPQVQLDDLPTAVGDATFTVTGTVTDNSSVPLQSISLTLNDGNPQDLGTETAFSTEVTLQPGENTIRVDAVDAVGNTGSASVTVQLDSEAPTTAPANLAARITPTGNAIQLTWEVDENATTYNVYRSDAEITAVSDLQPIGTNIVGTEFTDTGLVAGLTTYYAVTSVDSAGNKGTVVSNSPNIALITNAGGVASLADGTTATFGRDTLFENPSLSAGVTLGTLSEDSLAELPLAISDSAREISVVGQSGEAIDAFNRTATLTLAYPESIADSAASPRIFVLVDEKWVQLENQAVDTVNNTVSVQISSPGLYRLGEIQLNPWDVNSDNTVNIFDLVLVAREFGLTQENLATDINDDGTVNIFDLVLVGSHFGETYGSVAAAPVTSSLTGSSAEIKMVAQKVGDDLIQIAFHADIPIDLGGFQFDFQFASDQLSIVEATKGNLFESQGHQSYWIPPKAADGQLTVGSVAFTFNTPSTLNVVDEATVLAQITVRPRSSTEADVMATLRSIRLENVQMADLDGKAILANWRNQVDVTALAARKVENALLQNYPNPFNPETWIPYSIAEDAHVTIKVYDVLGRSVRTIDVGFVASGEYTTKERAVFWDGRNKQGEHVASGVYFYTMETGSFVATKKLLILK